MTGRTPHDVLGVSSDATDEEIRNAYLLRSKIVHPDRFDRATQSAEWALANRLLAEINEAYSQLRKRKSKAERIKRAEPNRTTPPRTCSEDAPEPPPIQTFGRLKAGDYFFDELSVQTRDRLIARVRGENKFQHAIPLAGAALNHWCALILGGWFVALFAFASGDTWSTETQTALLLVTIVVSCLQAWNLSWLTRWHLSPLKSFILITPLYVIRTHLDRVRVWPIWQIPSFRITHNFQNGAYQYTTVFMAIGDQSETFSVWPRSAVDSLFDAYRSFVERAAKASAERDLRYFIELDDFRECGPSRPSTNGSGEASRKAWTLVDQFGGVFVMTLLVCGIGFAAASSVNHRHRPQDVESKGTQVGLSPDSLRFRPSPPVPVFNEPELPLPRNGEVFAYSQAGRIAPFEIRSSTGSNYLVKLADANTGRPVLTVFVQGGSTVNIDVPLGRYVMKYAAGEKWYGYQHLFGPSTGYSKADQLFYFRRAGNEVSGYTITLYKVQNGNLEVTPIRPDEF